MRTLIFLLIGAPIALVVVALALVNNQPVTILLDPFTPETPYLTVTVSLYVIFFVTLMVGVFIGGIAVWARQGRFRKAARQNRREASRWRGEAERLREQTAVTPAGPALPAPGRRAA
ncbi:LapA family protein [Mongoliimonas terrestris]|uniref:LapA family protein n=1 Tax=Mongoliimonas terrestris TaxID=1709001 RepID=UPI0009F84186|nr:LapA family protein [Mongoliimonas terrestris]